jgi:hypothetical protein
MNEWSPGGMGGKTASPAFCVTWVELCLLSPLVYRSHNLQNVMLLGNRDIADMIKVRPGIGQAPAYRTGVLWEREIWTQTPVEGR